MKARTYSVILLIGTFVVPCIGSFTNAQTPQPRSTCSGPGCSAMSHVNLFIQTFASAGNSKGLRTTQGEQDERVRNAFYQIDSTRMQMERGTMPRAEGESIIDGFEKTIRAYLHDQTTEATVTATFGQASDIPALRKPLGGLLSVARQA